jgi:hypothetical protein
VEHLNILQDVPVDWESVDAVLTQERAKSFAFLQNALDAEVKLL